MLFRILADAVLVIHLLFVLFVVCGGLLVLWRRRAAWLHLPAAAWGALIELANWPCPLTPLEQLLRRRAEQGGYEGDFIEHYILAALYPHGLARPHQIALGIAVLAVNAAVYAWTWRRSARRNTTPDSGKA